MIESCLTEYATTMDIFYVCCAIAVGWVFGVITASK